MTRGLCPQQLEATLQIALDGCERRIECCRNLFGRQIFLVAKDQCGPLRFGQGRQQLFEASVQR